MEVSGPFLLRVFLLYFSLQLAIGEENLWKEESLCWKKKRGICISLANDDWNCPDPMGKTWWKGCPAGFICCLPSEHREFSDALPISRQCGFRPKDRGVDTSFRIVGGYQVPLGQVPWQVLLRLSQESMKRFPLAFCGGSIIDKHWVLTAAHCFDDKRINNNNLRLVTGLIKQRDSVRKDIPRVQILSAEKIIKHEKYDPNNYKNDIALVKLKTPIRFDNFSAPICLPRVNQTFVNQICTASGWGVVSATRNVLSQDLKAVHIPVIPWDRCSKTHLAKSAENTIFDHNICVNLVAGGRDACDGDSGGPLACEMTNGQSLLAGLTSWGDGDGCARGLPSVFTDVQAFVCWIKKHTGISF